MHTQIIVYRFLFQTAVVSVTTAPTAARTRIAVKESLETESRTHWFSSKYDVTLNVTLL